MTKKIEIIISEIERRIVASQINKIKDQDLFIGKLSIAYTCFHLYNTNKKIEYLDKMTDILNDVFNDIEKNTSLLLDNMSLVSGIPGLGLFLHQMNKKIDLDNLNIEQIKVITTTVYNKCINEISKENFDYFYGSAGLLFYLLEVDEYQKVEEIINIIYDYATKNSFLFFNKVDDPYSNGINFGYAHGSFALLAIFLKINNIGIQKKKTKEIIIKTTGNLLLFSRKYINHNDVTIMHDGFDYPSYFPYNVTVAKIKNKISPKSNHTLYHFTNRLGWCNSDLSRMYLLYKIGKTFNLLSYITVADELAKEILLRRHYKDTAVSDCYMCHGSSGIANIYKRTFELTGNILFHEAYEYWIKRTVVYVEKELMHPPMDDDLGLLTGLLGPLFVLNEYNNKECKGWDNLFLLS